MNSLIYIYNYLRGGVFRCLSSIRLKCAKSIEYGHGVMIYPSTDIKIRHKNCHIQLGDNTVLGCDFRNYAIVTPSRTRIITRLDKAQLLIGNRTNIFGANICIASKITIGDDCQIACGVNILDYNGHQTYKIPRGNEMDKPMPIHIGNNVWIGANSLILKGSIIGDNSIVGAGSVVKGEYPSNCIIIGNPARVVK